MKITHQLDTIIIDYLDGTLSNDNKKRLEGLISDSPELKNYIEEMSLIWYDIDDRNDFNTPKALNSLHDRINIDEQSIHSKHFSTRYILKIAAMIAILLTSTYGVFNVGMHYANQQQLTTIASLDHEKSAILLPDGSHVWLNASSKITYKGNMDGNKREISLNGEAYFEVKSDQDHPFIVTANNVEIRATGTAFNVSAYSEDSYVKTGLIEGRVKVSTDAHIYHMKAGDIVAVNKNTKKFKHRIMSQDNEVLAWRSNQLVFRDERVGDIIHQCERFFDIKIEASKSIRKLRFSGTFDQESSDDLLFIFKNILGIDAQKQDNTIYLKEMISDR